LSTYLDYNYYKSWIPLLYHDTDSSDIASRDVQLHKKFNI